MGITPLNSSFKVGSTSASASATLALTGYTPAVGDVLVVHLSVLSAGVLSAPTATGWTFATIGSKANGTTVTVSAVYGICTASGAATSLSLSWSSSGRYEASASAWSGVDTTSVAAVIIGHNAGNTGASTSLAPTSYTPGVDNALVLQLASWKAANSVTAGSPSTGTALYNNSNGGTSTTGCHGTAAYTVDSGAPAAYAPTWTLSTSSSYAALGVYLKPDTGIHYLGSGGSAATTSAGASHAITLTQAVSVGQTVVVTVDTDSPTSTAGSTATDSKGNTYTNQAQKSDGANYGGDILTAINITNALTTSDTITVTFPGGGSVAHNVITVDIFDNVSTVEVASSAAGGTTATWSATNVTTTRADDCLFAAVCGTGEPYTLTTAGYTTLNNLTVSGTDAALNGVRWPGATGSFGAGGAQSTGGLGCAAMLIALKSTDGSATVVTGTTLVQATGRGTQPHMVWASNSAVWWTFYGDATTPTKIHSAYSSDAITWTTSNDLTLANNLMGGINNNTGDTTGNGSNFKAISFANGTTDVVHVIAATAASSSSFQLYDCRATVTATVCTWGTPSQVSSNTNTSSPDAPSIALSDDNHILVADGIIPFSTAGTAGDMDAAYNGTADTGATWTPGTWSTHAGLYNLEVNNTSSRAGLTIGTHKVMFIWGDGNASSASDNDLYYSTMDATATAPSTPATVFGSTVVIKDNDWGAVARTTTDVHVVRRTGSNTYAHQRWGGSSWAAGQSIPTQTSMTDTGGVAMVSNGTDVWMFVIDSAAGNAIQYIKWSSGSSTWAASWTTLESFPTTRSYLNAVYGSNKILLEWLQNGDIHCETLSTASAGVSLAGEADGVATASAAVTIEQDFVGAATGAGTSSAALTVSHDFVLEADGAGTASVAVTIEQDFVGSANGLATATASVTIEQDFVGSANGVATGTVHLTDYFSGSATGVGTATAAVTIEQDFVGASNGLSTASAAITEQWYSRGLGTATVTLSTGSGASFSGSMNGLSTATALVTIEQDFVGSANGLGTATAAVTIEQDFIGSANGVATASAAVTVEQDFIGSMSGVSTASVTLTHSVPLVCEADGAGTATASLQVGGGFVCEADGRSTAIAAVTNSVPLVCSANGVATASALLITGSWSGSANGLSTASATLTHSVPLVGGANGSATATDALTVSHLLVEEADGAGTASLGLTVSHTFSGSASGASTGQATLSLFMAANGLSTAGAAVTVSHDFITEADAVATALAILGISHPLVTEADGAGTATLVLTIIPAQVTIITPSGATAFAANPSAASALTSVSSATTVLESNPTATSSLTGAPTGSTTLGGNVSGTTILP